MPAFIFAQEDGVNVSLAADDRIFLGEGLFETLRVVNNKPCYPKAHWQRLTEAASFLGLAFEVSFELWLEKLTYCIQLKKLKEGGIKVILTGGTAPRGLLACGKGSQLIFNTFSYERRSEPLHLVSAPWQRDAKNPIYQLKSINYLEAIIARRHAAAVNADDVLFFNFQNEATETTVANFFMIKNNQLLTPVLASGVLPGIIRQRLLFLCRQEGIACNEVKLHKTQLSQADAAFTCNALQGIRRVDSIDKQCLNQHPMLEILAALLIEDSMSDYGPSYG